MKLKTQLIISILGLSAFVSFPATAQTNQLESFFNDTPPYEGNSITRPLNPVEETQDSGYTDNRESAPTTPTIDNQSQVFPQPSNSAEGTRDSSYTEFQPPAATTPMRSDNAQNQNRNSAY